MKLGELPKMLVGRVEADGNVLTVHGRFDRLDGVATTGYFRLNRCAYAWADLVVHDHARGDVSTTNARDPDVAQLQVGEQYIWLSDYWQAPLVEAIADESTQWSAFRFRTPDAQYFRRADAGGRQRAGQGLPDSAKARLVQPGGWAHEHCDLCGAHIDALNPFGYTDAEGHFLCPGCYERYGRVHDLSFQVGA